MRRQYIAVAVVVAAVVVAGCAGGTGGDGTTTSPGTTGTTAGTTATTTDGVDRDAEAIRDAAVSAMEGVDSYRVASEQEAVVRANLVRRSTQTSVGVFDRENRELRVDRTTRVSGRTQEVSTWVVDRTAYSKSEVFTRQFGSQWVEVDVSGNFSRYWRLQDTLTRQRVVLENASTLSVAGTETVNGTEAVVLRANVTPEDYESLATAVVGGGTGNNPNVTVHRADFTFYLSAETDLPVRSEAQINTTVVAAGQSFDQNLSITIDYYGYDDPASIDLPEGAESAVNLSNRSASPALPAADGDRLTATVTGDRIRASPGWDGTVPALAGGDAGARGIAGSDAVVPAIALEDAGARGTAP